MTHEELCERARRWLSGTRRCQPVFSNIASCGEIPDAIGWSSAYGWRGSTVVECKTSLSDFHADKYKYLAYEEPEHHWQIPAARITLKEAKARRYKEVQLARMGDFRYYMCDPNVIRESTVAEYAPDHGLLYVEGRRVRIVRQAVRRDLVDKDGEIRYLRFAIINRKPDRSAAEAATETIREEPPQGGAWAL